MTMSRELDGVPYFHGIWVGTASGDAELAAFVNNLLTAPGVELAGPFPAELQQELVFPGAVATDTKEPAAAKAFLDYLTSPAAASAIKAKGMTPG